ncbi:hypothetical protein I4U23_021069 [Adineta vaga]|nr:hypothetical protein I4U23_021069 [Adineta vaga]
MSTKIQRRQSKDIESKKQAFEENEDKPVGEYQLRTSLNMENIDLEQVYEQAFFTLNNSTVELILNKNILSWSKVSADVSSEGNYQAKTSNSDDIDSIDLHYVYAISPVLNRSGWLLNNSESQSSMSISDISSISNSSLRGFELYSYEKLDDNSLQEIRILFQSNRPNQIQQWYQLISKIISKYKPKQNILIICNPYAGPKYSRHVYNTKIKPILDRAQHNIVYTEINESCSIDDVLNDLQTDFNALNSLVIIGGDGSVINVINTLLIYLAKENRTKLDKDHDLPSFPFPLCIIPTGTTNIICHSIHGTTDHCTPILHLLFNQRMRIDMSAIFDDNYNFVTVNFGAAAGFAANALRYFPRYSSYSPKKMIQKSFVKAASTKNLSPIDVEIRYIPADQDNTDMTRCYEGCSKCTPTTNENSIDEVTTFNDTHVKKINTRGKSSALNNDNTHRSSSLSRKACRRQNTQDEQWKTLTNQYIHVAVLTNANLWSFAPQGLSKFGHLADGLLDLLLLEDTTRKEFLRSIKRNGNSKNQYDFPFANMIKVKEIEIELKLSNLILSNETQNLNGQVVETLSNDSSDDDEEQLNNDKKSSPTKKYEPHPPDVPVSADSRRHRRTFTRQLSDQTQQQDEVDKIRSNPSKVILSVRRKTIFQSLKWKSKNTSLPRQSSVSTDERSQRKQSQRSTGGVFPLTKNIYVVIFQSINE